MTARAAGILLAMTGLAGAQATANYIDGDGATLVDQFPGIAGQGWGTAWITAVGATATSGATLTGSVLSATPMNSGGNYLSATLTASGSAGGQGVVARNYDNFGNLKVNAPHTIKFDLRLDTEITNLNYFQAYDRPAGGSDFANTGAWLIRARSADGVAPLTWAYYDGLKDGGAFDGTRFVESGVALVSGTTYHFEINIDPALLEYTVSINGGPHSARLAFRSGNSNNLSQLNVGGRVLLPGNVLTWSLDSVSVSGFTLAFKNLVLQPATESAGATLSATVIGGMPGSLARIEASTDLGIADPWESLDTTFLDENGEETVTNLEDFGSVGAPSDFFRVVGTP